MLCSLVQVKDRGLKLTVGHATPARDRSRFANERVAAFRKANGTDVILVNHFGLELQQSDVVLEIIRVVVGVNLFALDFKIFVR